MSETFRKPLGVGVVPCGCGRSETGYCTGLHAMTNEEYQEHLNSKKMLEENTKPQLLNE